MKPKPTITKIVRRRIRELRQAPQLMQAQISEAAGISVDAMSRMENGERSVGREENDSGACCGVWETRAR